MLSILTFFLISLDEDLPLLVLLSCDLLHFLRGVLKSLINLHQGLIELHECVQGANLESTLLNLITYDI